MQKVTIIKSLQKKIAELEELVSRQAKVVEDQAEVKWCLCCQRQVTAKFPVFVNAPVQYGEVIKSWGLYLQHEQLIPEDRLQSLFNDLFNVSLFT